MNEVLSPLTCTRHIEANRRDGTIPYSCTRDHNTNVLALLAIDWSCERYSITRLVRRPCDAVQDMMCSMPWVYWFLIRDAINLAWISQMLGS